MVTVVTEGIFSYCGVKVKVDTDRYLGPEQATGARRGRGGGPCDDRRIRLADAVARRRSPSHRRLARRRAAATCDALLDLSNGKPVELTDRRRRDDHRGSRRRADHQRRARRADAGRLRLGRRSACSPSNGSARSTKSSSSTITSPACCPSIRPASCSTSAPTGIKMKGRRSTPGRYFQVAAPGTGWGGTNISDPLSILEPFDPKHARAGLTHADGLARPANIPPSTGSTRRFARSRPTCRRRFALSVERIQENCEPALSTVLFIGGAGGSLRAGVTENPVRLTRSRRRTR